MIHRTEEVPQINKEWSIYYYSMLHSLFYSIIFLDFRFSIFLGSTGIAPL